MLDTLGEYIVSTSEPAEMGNCLVTEADALVLEYPDGKIQKVYFSTTAGQVMDFNPGHYVALATASTEYGPGARQLKLLPPDETLNVGSVYRLISFEEILKLKESGSNKLMRVRRPPIEQEMSGDTPGSLNIKEMRLPTGLFSCGKRRLGKKSGIIILCGCLIPEPWGESEQLNSASGMVVKQQAEGMSKSKSLERQTGIQLMKFKQWRPTLQSIKETER